MDGGETQGQNQVALADQTALETCAPPRLRDTPESHACPTNTPAVAVPQQLAPGGSGRAAVALPPGPEPGILKTEYLRGRVGGVSLLLLQHGGRCASMRSNRLTCSERGTA